MYLNIYSIGQAYGGPEEGGWWYSCGELLESNQVTNLARAKATVEKLNKKFKTKTSDYSMGYGEHDGVDLNGEGDDNFLMAGGHWGYSNMRAMIEDKPGRDFPTHRPHYE
jgi:hypothetical protein